MADAGASRTTTVPMLPTNSLDESIRFYETLGFELTLRQKAPNGYAVVRYADFELHLFSLAKLEAENNFTMCLVISAEVEEQHALFASRMKEDLGRAPYRGLPRLSRMRPGQTRFTLTDIAGNSVIFVKRGRKDDEAASRYRRPGLTALQRGLSVAERLRDFKTDDAAAARALDKLLTRFAGDTTSDYKRAIEARIELAETHEETERADELRGLLAMLK